MDSGSEGINVYADAKGEYTRQLTQFSQPAITQYFLNLLEETKVSEKDSKKLLLSFQASLKNIFLHSFCNSLQSVWPFTYTA